MRTIALRVEDEFYEQVTLLARLSERPLTEELREALNNHVAKRAEDVDLSAHAEAALAEVNRQADARRKALQSFIKKEPAKAARKGGDAGSQS